MLDCDMMQRAISYRAQKDGVSASITESRITKREFAGSSEAIGQRVLADTTYDYREGLDGQACDELYMTSGNYHRLAEEDEVWWDPLFQKGIST